MVFCVYVFMDTKMKANAMFLIFVFLNEHEIILLAIFCYTSRSITYVFIIKLNNGEN